MTTFVILPYFDKPNASPYYSFSNCMIGIVESLLFGLSLPLVFRMNRFGDLIFAQAVIMLCVSDFALRSEPALPVAQVDPIFEHAWDFGMALFAGVLFVNRQLPFASNQSLPGYYSIRTLISTGSILSLLLAVGAMLSLDIFRLMDGYNLSTVLAVVVTIWMIFNVLAAAVSRQVLRVEMLVLVNNNALSRPQSDSRSLSFQSIGPGAGPSLAETRVLIDRYDRLAAHANRALKDLSENAEFAAIGRAAQMVAHDLKRPMSMAKIVVDMILSSKNLLESKEQFVRFARHLETSLAHTETMLREIMSIGRAEEPSDLKAVDCQKLVTDVLDEARVLRPQLNVSIKTRFAAAKHAWADSNQIRRVITNIIHNACDAMKGQGCLEITVNDFDDAGSAYIKLQIKNDGPLILEEHVPRVFDPFFSHGKKDGTGLGLCIARKIVRNHCGDIACRSDPEHGTSFTITLPAVKPGA